MFPFPFRIPIRRLTRALATLLLCAALPAAAAVYKWTDATGRVVYSDLPPPPDVKVETVRTPPPGNPNALKEMIQKDAESRQRQAQRSEGEAKAAQAQSDALQRNADCARIKGQVATLGASQEVVYRLSEKGERVVMDDAARRMEQARLEAWLRENCAGR